MGSFARRQADPWRRLGAAGVLAAGSAVRLDDRRSRRSGRCRCRRIRRRSRAPLAPAAATGSGRRSRRIAVGAREPQPQRRSGDRGAAWPRRSGRTRRAQALGVGVDARRASISTSHVACGGRRQRRAPPCARAGRRSISLRVQLQRARARAREHQQVLDQAVDAIALALDRGRRALHLRRPRATAACTCALITATGVFSACAAAAKNWSRMRSRCSVSVMSCMTLTTIVAGSPSCARARRPRSTRHQLAAARRVQRSPCNAAVRLPRTRAARRTARAGPARRPDTTRESAARTRRALMPSSSLGASQPSMRTAAGFAYTIVRGRTEQQHAVADALDDRRDHDPRADHSRAALRQRDRVDAAAPASADEDPALGRLEPRDQHAIVARSAYSSRSVISTHAVPATAKMVVTATAILRAERRCCALLVNEASTLRRPGSNFTTIRTAPQSGERKRAEAPRPHRAGQNPREKQIENRQGRRPNHQFRLFGVSGAVAAPRSPAPATSA